MIILLFLSLQAPAYPQLVDGYYQEWAAKKPVSATELRHVLEPSPALV